jgi:hypothetical protein
MITQTLTFEELVKLEPRLMVLMAEIRKVSSAGQPNFCANAIWYGYKDPANSFKRRMSDLVGIHAHQTGILESSAAYDVAYAALYSALPSCRHPGGFC